MRGSGAGWAIRLVVIAVVVVVAVVRVRSGRARRSPLLRAARWLRDRRPARSAGRVSPAVRMLGDVGLVAGREVRQRVRGRTFRIITLLILAAVAAAIVIPTLTRGKSTERVGVFGTSAATDATVQQVASELKIPVFVQPEPTLSAMEAAVRSGQIAFAIESDTHVVVNKPIAAGATSSTATLVRALSTTLGVQAAYRAAGLSPAQIAHLSASRPLPVRTLTPASVNGGARTTATIGLILLFVMLTQYNTWTLVGVMEEKSSRVVEVLLATVRPVQLLGGKVLGIAAVVFAQAAIIVAFALALAKGVGSSLLQGSAPAEIVAILAWLVLGYAFYSWVYAAAGSMAERQDQVQSLVLPLSLPLLFGYVVSLTAIGSGTPSTLIKVLAYLPPTAPFGMPVLVALRAVTWWQFAAAVVLSILGTIGVARLAAGVYRRSVLRTGSRVRIGEALTRATRG